jgi:2,4-dienoyl-CoA reductase-like NADH-dependent reductase (Old Yellow Enzyme family)/thioredoxin reductase
MHPRYPNVFSPIRLGPVELKNRFYSSPHICPLTTATGGPSEDFIQYYVERVKDGGCGLAILSLAGHERSIFVQPSPYPRANIPAFRTLADAVHEAGGKVFGQIWYWWGTPGHWDPLSPPVPALTPSVLQYSHQEKREASREMTREDIRAMIDAFRQSAENLREASFDGIMLHAAHGAIIEQFLSPYFNRRTDEYGGSFENRLRFLEEVLDVTRQAIGRDMALGIRLNCDELLPGGLEQPDSYRILQRLAGSGRIDYVDLDIAIEPDQFHLGMPPAFVEPQVYRPYVEAVRGAAGDLPVLSVLGRLTSVADGEAAIASGVCDMVGAGRALIAEPHLVKNAYNGHEERSRTCIACNWCMAALYDGAQSCTINPASWRERAWGVDSFTPATRPSKVIVIGAGPGGLEAARVCALRGHEVTLVDQNDRVGGALTVWATLPGREAYQQAVDWWERELRRLGVTIRLGERASAADILAAKPDAVILATGSRYSAAGHSNHRDLPIPGYDRAFVHRPEDVLSDKVRPTGRVVILDAEGLHTGVGIAEILAKAGADVEYVTPHFAPMSPRVFATQDAHFIIRRLKAARVRISPSTYIRAIGDRQVNLYDVHSDEERSIDEVDAVILSTGREPVNELERGLAGNVAQLFTIGDAAAPRMWATASYEGHKFARLIGEPGAPASISEVYFATA